MRLREIESRGVAFYGGGGFDFLKFGSALRRGRRGASQLQPSSLSSARSRLDLTAEDASLRVVAKDLSDASALDQMARGHRRVSQGLLVGIPDVGEDRGPVSRIRVTPRVVRAPGDFELVDPVPMRLRGLARISTRIAQPSRGGIIASANL